MKTRFSTHLLAVTLALCAGFCHANARADDPMAVFLDPGTDLKSLKTPTRLVLGYNWKEPKFLGAGKQLRPELWSDSTLNGSASLDIVLKYPLAVADAIGRPYADLVNGVELGFAVAADERGMTGPVVGYRVPRDSTVNTNWPDFDSTRKDRSEVENVAYQRFEDALLSPYYTLTPYIYQNDLRVFHVEQMRGAFAYRSGNGELVQKLPRTTDMLIVFRWNPATKAIGTFVLEQSAQNEFRYQQLDGERPILRYDVTTDSVRAIATGKSQIFCTPIDVGQIQVPGLRIYDNITFGTGLPALASRKDLTSGVCEAPTTYFQHTLVPDATSIHTTSGDWAYDGPVLRSMVSMVRHIRNREVGMVVEGLGERLEKLATLRERRVELPENLNLVQDSQDLSRLKWFLSLLPKNSKLRLDLSQKPNESDKNWTVRAGEKLNALPSSDVKIISVPLGEPDPRDESAVKAAFARAAVDGVMALATGLGYENPFTEENVEAFKKSLDNEM